MQPSAHTMSFSAAYLPDNDFNSLDALFGLWTPPKSPTNLAKAQDGHDQVLAGEVWDTVQNVQAQASSLSRAPAGALYNVAGVGEGSDSDAEGEDDPDLFPDFLGREEEDDTILTGKSVFSFVLQLRA